MKIRRIIFNTLIYYFNLKKIFIKFLLHIKKFNTDIKFNFYCIIFEFQEIIFYYNIS